MEDLPQDLYRPRPSLLCQHLNGITLHGHILVIERLTKGRKDDLLVGWAALMEKIQSQKPFPGFWLWIVLTRPVVAT
jgi:hypothetical protein